MNGPDVIRNLLLVAALVLANALFAMAEAAFLSVRRTRVEQLVDEGNRRARIVALLLSEPTRLLSTLQVGVTLVTLFSAGAAADSAVAPLATWLSARFDGTAVEAAARPVAFVSVMLALSLVTLVVGEITPKSIAVQHAEQVALNSAIPVVFLQTVLRPVVSLVSWMSGLAVRPFGGTATFHTSAMSEEELKIMVEQSEEHGVIERGEKEMIHSIFEFGDTSVRKVMTPRLDITGVDSGSTVEDVVRVVAESGHSRVPIYEENLDNIVGIVHVKDILTRWRSASPPSLSDIMRRPYFVPDNKRVDDLLGEFKRNKSHIAVVRDEYGTVTGIVTIEDIVEEIVGDIQDEYDLEEPEVRQLDEVTSIIDGRMSLGDFNERMGVELPDEEADTLGGFVFNLLGHQPMSGEVAEFGAMRFRVENTDGRRVLKVRFVRASPMPTTPETATSTEASR